MASNLPLPIPPRTPTPPSDDATDRHAPQMNAGISVDRDALSPLRETFPKSLALDAGTQDRLSPTKASFNLSAGPADTVTPTQNGSSDSTPAGPFNFNTTVMAKGPVAKSVHIRDCDLWRSIADGFIGEFRMLDNAVVISTSTAAFLIRSSSNPLLARPWPCPIRFRYQR